MNIINIFAKQFSSLALALISLTAQAMPIGHFAPHPELGANAATGAPVHMTTEAKPAGLICAQVSRAYANLPISFEPNYDQADSQVKFLSRCDGYDLHLTSNEAVFILKNRNQRGAGMSRKTSMSSRRGKGYGGGLQLPSVLRMKILGANPNPRIEGLNQLPGHSNYLIGNDPNKWRTNVAQYSTVKCQDIYPGVSLAYYGSQRQLEYDFILSPGADLGLIRLSFEGAGKMYIDGRGDLVLMAAGCEIRHHSPYVYQEIGGVRTEIKGWFVVKGEHEFGFEVGLYDKSKPLVIDPVLTYSTYFGGIGTETLSDIGVDASGSVYVAGLTSANFTQFDPPKQTTLGAGKSYIFVAKMNQELSAIVYITYFGGDNNDGFPKIAVDSSGSACVIGSTSSRNFPLPSAIKINLGEGDLNAFITKLSPAGSEMVYFTLLGGTKNEFGNGIAIDSSDNIYVTGETNSPDLETKNGYRSANSFGSNAFIAKINPAAGGESSLLYTALVGGNGDESGDGISVGSSGNAYVIGTTNSSDLVPPESQQNSIQANFKKGTCGPQGNTFTCFDTFIVKLNATGTALDYATYLGGSQDDQGRAIAVDSSGNAYITGTTSSKDFPTSSPMQPNLKGISDLFAAKLNPTGSALVYSTYFGGTNEDTATGLKVDPLGNLYLTGKSDSLDLLTESPLQIGSGSRVFSDAFLLKLNASGSEVLFSTYLGGNGEDESSGIALDSSGSVYLSGSTGSSDFPVTFGSFQTAKAADLSFFIVKIASSPEGVFTITSIVIDGKKLFVFGKGFDRDAVILLNGEELRTKSKGGKVIVLISQGAGRIIKPGHSVALRVRNPNGALSPEFIFVRPIN
jgi:hypothetical protein